VSTPLRAEPQGWFDEMAYGLSWRPDEVVLMVWVYYDESGNPTLKAT
jgi:hypothetical protein